MNAVVPIALIGIRTVIRRAITRYHDESAGANMGAINDSIVCRSAGGWYQIARRTFDERIDLHATRACTWLHRIRASCSCLRATDDELIVGCTIFDGRNKFQLKFGAMDSISLIRDFFWDRLAIEPEKVVPEARLAGLGVDSLMLLELMFEFEDRSGIKLGADLKSPRTVGEVVALMDGLLAEKKDS
jgi:acyl carrier protein